MYENKCKNCGVPMFARTQAEVRQYCSKRCYGAFLHAKRARPYDSGKPRSRDIHPAGYNNLVCAIVRQAREDVMNRKPESLIRQDAEDFFLSDYFEQLTELDGFEILYQLSLRYEQKHRKKQKGA